MTEISFPPVHDLSPSELEIRKQHLVSEIRREPERRLSLPTIPQLRLRVALPAMAAFGAAACAVIFTGAFGGSRTHHVNQMPGSFGSGGLMTLVAPPSLAHPLPEAQQTTLNAASAAWGSPLVLPNTALVQPSDAGPVWVRNVQSQTVAAAVTFSARGVIEMYLRPTFSDPQTQYREMARGINGAKEVDLNGTPALVISQNSDSTGQNFGVADFQANGSEIAVLGHYDDSTLESLALSIINQYGAN
jgi:hypothetical protein